MDLFTLNVVGYEGELVATVYFETREIASFGVKDLKDAEKKARSAAQAFQNENRPVGYTTISQTFTV